LEGHPLGLKSKASYASGNFGTSLLYNAFALFALTFYVDKKYIGLDGVLYGIAITVYGLWSVVNNPLFGIISDRTRTRWGRRRPYIGMGSIFLLIFYFLVWTPPVEGTLADPFNIPVFIYFLVVICAFSGFYALVSVPYVSLFPELYENPRDRAQVQLFRQLFAAIGLILAFAMPMLIESLSPSFGVFNAYKYLGLVFGVAGCIPYIISVAGNRERKEFSLDANPPLGQNLKTSLRNRAFLLFAVAGLMINYAFLWLEGMLQFFTTNFIGISGGEVTILLGVMFITAMPFLPIWGRCYRRFGTRKSFIVTMAIFALSLQPLLFVSSFIMTIPVMLLAGVGLSGYMMLPEIMIGEIADEDEVKSKVRREGIYYGMNGFLGRFSFVLTGLTTALIFGLTGYQGGAPPTPEVNLMFRLSMTMIPLIAMVLALLALKYYPLHGERLETVRKEIEKIHKDKAKRLKSA
jgi:GPH family glycoside/pentoside/hexuronide:cation symporter